MDIVEKYELFSNIGYISAIIFFIVTVILFFALKIVNVFGYLTGITRKKAISKIKMKNENSDNNGNNFITDKINSSNINNRKYTSEIENDETYMLNNNETTLLDSNQRINVKFEIIKDITFIHTNVNI